MRVHSFHISISRALTLATGLIALTLLAACKLSVPTANVPTPSASPLPATTAVPAKPTATLLSATSTPLPPVSSTPLPPSTTPAPSASPTQQFSFIGTDNVTDLQKVNQVQENGAQFFTFANQGQSFALASGGQISFYNTTPSLMRTSIPVENITMLTASADQRSLAWANQNNDIRLVNIPQPSQSYTLTHTGGQVTSLTFAPSGKQLASASYENQLMVWDASSGQISKQWELPYWLSDLSYSPDGTQIGGVDLPNFTVHILDASTGKEIKSLTWNQSTAPALYGAYFSPDWKTIAWVARGTVQLMSVDSGKLGAVLNHEDAVNTLAWSPDSSILATASAATVDGNFVPVVELWSVDSGKTLKTLVLSNPAIQVSFSPDEKSLATLDSTGTLQFWAVKGT